MNKAHRTLVTCGFAVLTTAASQGAFTLVEDFESFADGDSIGSFAENNASNTLASEVDGTTLGSNGNIVARLLDTGGSGGAGYNGVTVADTTMGSYAFDLYRVSGDPIIFGFGDTSPFTSQRWAGGSIPFQPSIGTTIQLSVLFNRTGSTQTYTNPVTSMSENLSDQSIALFTYTPSTGTYEAVQTSLAAIDNANPTRAWFYQVDNGQTILLDNVRVSADLEVFAIPEPSTALLGALGALALLRRRR